MNIFCNMNEYKYPTEIEHSWNITWQGASILSVPLCAIKGGAPKKNLHDANNSYFKLIYFNTKIRDNTGAESEHELSWLSLYTQRSKLSGSVLSQHGTTFLHICMQGSFDIKYNIEIAWLICSNMNHALVQL